MYNIWWYNIVLNIIYAPGIRDMANFKKESVWGRHWFNKATYTNASYAIDVVQYMMYIYYIILPLI